MKTRSHHTPISKWNLIVMSSLQKGWKIKEISKYHNIPKSSLSRCLKSLKLNGNIEKIGYGVWKVKSKEGLNTVGVGQGRVSMELLPQDFVRGHGFMIKLILPFIKNWNNRRDYLKKNSILFSEKPRYESLIIEGVRVWLCNSSIIYYLPKSYYAKDSTKSHALMLNDFYNLLKKTESLLNVKIRYGKEYKFKVKRNHYALIKNALAQDYNSTGQKLEVKDKDGLWLLIDNSFNLNELETIHPATAKDDNEKVRESFNSIKQGVTPQFLLESLNKVVDIQKNNEMKMEFYNKNIVSHVESIQQLGTGVRQLVNLVKKDGHISKDSVKDINEIQKKLEGFK